MKKPGNYEYMAVVREIEKLNEIKDPIKLKQQQDIVEGFKLEYGTELFEQMVKDAEQKTLDYKKSLLENNNIDYNLSNFLDELKDINKILNNPELLEKERFNYVNKLGIYA